MTKKHKQAEERFNYCHIVICTGVLTKDTLQEAQIMCHRKIRQMFKPESIEVYWF
jgi:hypothetical protein